MALVVFNDDQIKDLQRLSDKKDYPAAYSYMHGILAAETAKTENSARAKKRRKGDRFIFQNGAGSRE